MRAWMFSSAMPDSVPGERLREHLVVVAHQRLQLELVALDAEVVGQRARVLLGLRARSGGRA